MLLLIKPPPIITKLDPIKKTKNGGGKGNPRPVSRPFCNQHTNSSKMVQNHATLSLPSRLSQAYHQILAKLNPRSYKTTDSNQTQFKELQDYGTYLSSTQEAQDQRAAQAKGT